MQILLFILQVRVGVTEGGVAMGQIQQRILPSGHPHAAGNNGGSGQSSPDQIFDADGNPDAIGGGRVETAAADTAAAFSVSPQHLNNHWPVGSGGEANHLLNHHHHHRGCNHHR